MKPYSGRYTGNGVPPTMNFFIDYTPLSIYLKPVEIPAESFQDL